MTTDTGAIDAITTTRQISDLLDDGDLKATAVQLAALSNAGTVDVLERLGTNDCAVAYRLLPKDRALSVFEALDPVMQKEILTGLQDAEVAALFEELDPDDRVWLLDELPATLAPRLLRGLTQDERDLTAAVLGYPQNAVGRRMSPEYITVHPSWSTDEAIQKARAFTGDDSAAYVLPVTDGSRTVVGTVTLHALLAADPGTQVGDIVQRVVLLAADDDAEGAAREVLDERVLALPVVDTESRLLGMLTVEGAAKILERAESEDTARQGGAEPLHRPYLSSSILSIVRSRIVWLLVLAIGASLTVQVLANFEEDMAKVTALALFVPLLIGTGGNTGNQAATTVTRALALHDVEVRDVWRVLGREIRVGLVMGLLLGLIALGITGAIFGWEIGIVIGLTLLAVCTMAASVGGIMPIVAKAVRVDPAVFSNPFITTFVDATGLIVYFLIAQAVLGL